MIGYWRVWNMYFCLWLWQNKTPEITPSDVKVQFRGWLEAWSEMDFLSPNKGDNQQSRGKDPLSFCVEIFPIVLEKRSNIQFGTVFNWNGFTSLFVELSLIVPANISNISLYLFLYWVDIKEVIALLINLFFIKSLLGKWTL